jgi:Tfp pilus assembly protein PilF
MNSRIEQLQAFLKAQPKDSFLRHALALEYIKLNDLAKAEVLFVELLQDNSTYVGSYYHLAKLYETLNENDKAIAYYTKGMEIAKEVKDNHAYNELQAAYEDLVY